MAIDEWDGWESATDLRKMMTRRLLAEYIADLVGHSASRKCAQLEHYVRRCTISGSRQASVIECPQWAYDVVKADIEEIISAMCVILDDDVTHITTRSNP